jgi:hypothetical protein
VEHVEPSVSGIRQDLTALKGVIIMTVPGVDLQPSTQRRVDPWPATWSVWHERTRTGTIDELSVRHHALQVLFPIRVGLKRRDSMTALVQRGGIQDLVQRLNVIEIVGDMQRETSMMGSAAS